MSDLLRVEVSLVQNHDIVDLCMTKWSVNQGYTLMESQVSLAEQEKKKKEGEIHHRLIQDVDDHFEDIYMHTGRESHADSDDEG